MGGKNCWTTISSQRETDRQADRQTEIERWRKTKRDRGRDRQTKTERNRKRDN